jgi:N-formylglutamate amidohydrolase
MAEPLFEVFAPERWQVPVVFNSPHSGQFMPPGLLKYSRLTDNALRQSEDCFVDELFGTCVSNGAPMQHALASRAYLDLNREPYELDAKMFNESLPGYINTGSARVAAGFGTIPRLVGESAEIYRYRLPLTEALNRIETFYKPYHRTLSGLLDEAHGATGFALLLDCHSMPSSAARQLAKNAKSIDVVLGDRYGSSCARELSEAVEDFFSNLGLNVVRNRPYAGGFITETHGAPHHNRHAIQIEINRALYMDERHLSRNPGFTTLQSGIAGLSRHLHDVTSDFYQARRYDLAAE